jgi:ribosomal 50S subunit-recycling heat shock protein
VRGTEFETVLDPEGMATVVVFGGEVTVQGEGMKEAVVVRVGQQVRFTGEKVLGEPAVVDLQQRDRWWE